MLRVGGTQLFRAETTGPVKDTQAHAAHRRDRARAVARLRRPQRAVRARVLDRRHDAVRRDLRTRSRRWRPAASRPTTPASATSTRRCSKAIAIVFMFARRRQLRAALHRVAARDAGSYFADSELRAFFAILLVASCLIALELYGRRHLRTFGDALRHATVPDRVEPHDDRLHHHRASPPGAAFAPLLLILLGFIGGCSGSTSGGMKVARVVMLVRQGVREVQQLVHPKGRFLVKIGRRARVGCGARGGHGLLHAVRAVDHRC